MDAHFYTQKILPAADMVMRNNMQQLGQYFANEFMGEHDLNNGANPNVQRNATQFYNFVASEAQRMNNGSMTVNDQQLFHIVGAYVRNVFDIWQRSQQQQPQMNGLGGWGQQQQIGSSFNRQVGLGGGLGNFNRPQGSSMMNGDVIGGQGNTPQQQQSTQQNQVAPAASLTPIASTAMVTYSPNPLDETYANPVDLRSVRDQVNWGAIPARDRSIVIMGHNALKSADERLVVHDYDAFARIYIDNEMDAVKLFFHEAPDRFLAELFSFRLFYNHVEELAIGTAEFQSVRDQFVAAVEKNREISTYSTIIAILDKLPHGPRMVMARYLVEHINRALRIGIGMEAAPGTRIKFNQIEDLEELLGPNFDIPLLQVPNARDMIVKVVNTAVFNALTGYSDVMFADEATFDPSIIKTSPVFPFSLAGVYPTKAIIPDKDNDLFPQFFAAMQKNQLANKTFVRSIRSVIITNVLGQQALGEVTVKPKAIGGQAPALLNRYVLRVFAMPNQVKSACTEYDEYSHTGNGDGADYKAYLDNPLEYERAELAQLSHNAVPGLPVDQTVYAFQYKKSPYEYLTALDLLTTMDAPQGHGNRAILARKEVKTLHPTA